MRKIWTVCVFLLVSIPCLMAQQAQSISDVISDAVANYLSPLGGKGRAGEKVLVLHFKSPTGALNEWAIDRFTDGFKQRGLTAVERRNWSASLAAAVAGKTDTDLDDASFASLGAQAAVNTVFAGAFVPQGSNWALTIRAVSVANKKIVWSKKYLIRPGDTFTQLATPAPAVVPAPAPAASAPAASAPAPAVVPASAPAASAPAPAAPQVSTQPQSYNIGDIGPAGGLIFFDKGNNSGGWRYLEAAPEDIDGKLYAAREELSFNTERSVGNGKANTQAIMKEANDRGGGFGWAAQACDALEVNGFDDWFLPSRDELHYLYGNLHVQDLGNFKNELYWSSTYHSYYGNYFWAEKFSDGSQTTNRFGDQCRVRAIRQF
jgi:hypothetical protein